MEEFLTFLRTYFPKFDEKHLKFPHAFTYDHKIVGGVDGFVDGPVDKSRGYVGNLKGKDWKKAVLGAKGEETLDVALHMAFQERTSLMLNGFERDKLFKIAKDCITFKLNEAKAQDDSVLALPLLPEERELHKLFGVDASKLETEVKEFLKELFSGSEEMDAAGLENALQAKCRNPNQLNPDNPGPDKRPVFERLGGKQQTNYREDLRSRA